MENVNITSEVAETVNDVKMKWRAVDALIETAPLNCTKIVLVVTADGHSVEYFSPSSAQLKAFSWKNVNGEWIK